MNVIFKTDRLLVKKLVIEDLEKFHELHSNMNVMRFVRGKTMSFEENENELESLIRKYNEPGNDFWIYAVKSRANQRFIGTVALVKSDEMEDEIGYRLLEKEWGKGFGLEVAQGLVNYCRLIEVKELIAFVAIENTTSIKILKKVGFKYLKDLFCKDLNILEHKYKMKL